uniref:Pyruvate kinase n=1 Tax=Oryza punctata TaxID=4537 RepID=A0A0E0MB11_ORYPU
MRRAVEPRKRISVGPTCRVSFLPAYKDRAHAASPVPPNTKEKRRENPRLLLLRLLAQQHLSLHRTPMAAPAEIGGFAAARMAAPALRPAPPAAAPPQPRRAVAARSLRTSTSERVAADLALGTNGSLSAQSIAENTADNTSQVVSANSRRKSKIVCTIGPSTNTREMIWKLAEAGMNVARMNMSHGDHQSHQKVIDLVKEYNAKNTDGNVIAIMLDTKGPEVRSGDVPEPIMLEEGQEFNFTIRRGVSTKDTVSVNYDDFINDVEVGDILLVDGGMMSLAVKSKTADTVKCEVVDGGELKSRRHLNVRGKSATLPSITEKDWEDIKFGVENGVDFYAVSFVKDAKVIHELKDYLKSANADIHVIPKIESADSIPNLQSIIAASDGAMVARGDLGAELPIEEVPLLQEEIVRTCRSMQKPVIVATNMLESMIDHPTPTRAEVSDIAIAVREGSDAIMLSGETAHGKFPLKAVKVMHTVAQRTESSLYNPTTSPSLVARPQALLNEDFSQSQLSKMFGSHATMMANTLCTPIIVFTRTGSMAVLLSHYRPSSTIFAFTNEERVKQRLALYQGVVPIYMKFSDDAEETFSRAISSLLSAQFVKEGDYVTLVQSGVKSIWREESTHHIQVRKVQC